MTPYTALFDLDGTLIDSVELILNSKAYAFESRGLAAPSDAEWLRWLGTPLRNTFRRYAPAGDEAEVDRFIAAYREYQTANHDRLLRPYEGATEALTALRDTGHAIGIVTSKSVELSERGLAQVGLLDLVDTIVGADSTQRHKPDPEPVLVALERLGAAPGRAIFVGDSVHDMYAGNAAGVTTVAALWGPFTREQLAPSSPSVYVNHVGELPAFVARLDGPAPETHRHPQA